jgi:hypothetical protein
MTIQIDDTVDNQLDVISEIDETMLDDEKIPASAMERERNDIIKVKKVCKCSSELVHSMFGGSRNYLTVPNCVACLYLFRFVLARRQASGRLGCKKSVRTRRISSADQPWRDGN